MIVALLIAGFTVAPAAAQTVYRYTIDVDGRLAEMHVAARFPAPVSRIRARGSDAGGFLIEARDCERERVLGHRGRYLSVPDGGLTCLDYVVDLREAAAAEGRNATLGDGNVVVSPAAWLWRPSIGPGSRLEARFRLPEGIAVSLPWRPLPGTNHGYVLRDSPRNARALAAFGDFVASSAEIPGAGLRIALMRPAEPLQAPAILDWLRGAAHNVSLAYGRFPNPSPHVVVIPVGAGRWRSDSPVPFGRVVRDGGESIEFYIDETRPITEFRDDWTATHEFSHLMLPFVPRRHRWITEGFAQYYQNVLLARAGRYDERRAWQELYEGFERGRRSRPELSPNDAAAEGVGAATMKIYWSGATLALMADVELRARSGGRESLDLLLDRLQHCCLPSTRSWSGTELLAKLDDLADSPVLMPLYRRYADEGGFPDTGPVFARLGVRVDGGRVTLDDSAELAATRRAITADDRPEVPQERFSNRDPDEAKSRTIHTQHQSRFQKRSGGSARDRGPIFARGPELY